MIAIIALSVFLLFYYNSRKNIAYSEETINEYVKKIEKHTNEKDRKKLEQIVQNEISVNQLLGDFSDDDMSIKGMNYYNLTDTVLRVELQCEFKTGIKPYLIMIDNKNSKWETYVTGFIWWNRKNQQSEPTMATTEPASNR